MSYALTQEMIFKKAKSTELKEITKLNFHNYSLNDISELSKCISLESVSFSSNQIKSLKTFLGMINLKELSLANNVINDINEVRYLSSCINLKRLWLKGNPICKLKGYREYIIKLIPSLEKLDDMDVLINERDNEYPFIVGKNGQNYKKENSYENNYKFKKKNSVPLPYLPNEQIINNYNYQKNDDNCNYNRNNNKERYKTPLMKRRQNSLNAYINNNSINNNYNEDSYKYPVYKDNKNYRKLYSREEFQHNKRYKNHLPKLIKNNDRNYNNNYIKNQMHETLNEQQGILDCISTLLVRLEKNELIYILNHIDNKLSKY